MTTQLIDYTIWRIKIMKKQLLIVCLFLFTWMFLWSQVQAVQPGDIFPPPTTPITPATAEQVAKATAAFPAPPNTPPVASFSMDVTSGPAPLTVKVDASASSDADGIIQSYQWTSQHYPNVQSEGQTPTGKIASLTFSSAGTHVIELTVTDDKGETATTGQMVTVIPTAHLVNISTRAYTSTGLSSVIAGFIIQGTGACTVMIRGFGKGIGLSPLLDTQLLLQTFPDGRVLANNQSWATGNDFNQIPSGLFLPDSSDAGILIKLAAGAYTATMTPESVVGVGLIGVDQVSCEDANTQLVNISTRAEVRDNLEVVIAGFIIDGPGTVKIMLRGFGAGIGISPCLDTNLRLDKFPASGDSLAVNDNWETAANATLIPAALKLPNNTDAGILVDLPAGAYTATMTRTASSCTGVGLIGVDVVQ
jgi:hypothetical protein